MQTMILVDFENVQTLDVSCIDEETKIIVFVGHAQKTLPTCLVLALHNIASRVEWRQVTGNGSNALDFFIACELGRLHEKGFQGDCLIISKDKGFDPLISFLNIQGLSCQRIESLSNEKKRLTVLKESADKPIKDINVLLARLEKLEEIKRPHTLKALLNYGFSVFQQNKTPEQLVKVIQKMMNKRLISIENEKVTYLF